MVISLCRWLWIGVFLLLKGVPARHMPLSHPFYVSVVEINHNSKDKLLEISCKVFTNDFESALEKFSQQKIDLSDSHDKAAADKSIAAYISGHLQLKIEGQPVQLQFLGSEKEAEATWSYFQVVNIPVVRHIDITNTILYEAFPGEINIIHVTVKGNRKSTKLSNPENHTVFDF